MDEGSDKNSDDLEVKPVDAESVEVKDETQAKLNESNNDSKRTLRVVAGVGLVIVLVLAGIVFALSGTDESDANTVTSETSEAAADEETEAENQLTVEQIEAAVREGGELWSDDVRSVLEEFDASNDNVGFTFTDAEIAVSGNGIPTHDVGQFPNANNPNTISEQDIMFNVSRSPVYVGTPTDIRTFGYTLGGIKIEPGTAERDPETNTPIEAFNTGVFDPGVDENNAHVQPTGAYHYHGLPSVLVTTGEAHSNIIGFAADGFPIYGDHGFRDPTDLNSTVDHMTSSWQLKEGERPAGEPEGLYSGDYTTDFEYVEGRGDLDECNGRFTVTPEFPNGTYAYFVTETFPFFGRCVMGEVTITDAGAAAAPTGGSGGGTQGPPPQGGPGPQ